ncbi:MAG: GH36-type glycosyl hydrolase domain-containing protein, partial [Candidatus Limnocylindrales bacterium]
QLPFVGDGAPTAPASALDHVSRALEVIEASRIPGTTLPAYGHGDWNDSLQPADPALAAGLVSSWTVALQAHALRTLAGALEAIGGGDGRQPEIAARARRIADEGSAALLDVLVADGVLAGYGLFDPNADPATPQRPSELLVHPSDARTGLRYSVLPMIHAISGDLLPEDLATAHLRLIVEHLTGPDGARLFDAPAAYSGGPMHVFQRAEASAFFGREIGLMYTHAHLRYAEALARVGDADGFLRALALVNPIGVTERTTSARPRQSTTYFSSSDAAFSDRYAAAAGYRGAIDGSVPLEGGWRVYSSGPGIYLRLVVERLLGIRHRGAIIEIDPVLPPALDGLVAAVPLLGQSVSLRYTVRGTGSGVNTVRSNGTALRATPLANPYRPPGVAVRTADVIETMTAAENTLTIELG